MSTTKTVIVNNKGNSLITTAIWIVGILLAKGFWSTFFAVICPLWGLYLILEKFVLPYIN